MADNKWYIGMTEKAIRQKVANTALALVGIKEGTVEHKKIIDTYNTKLPKLPRGYKMTYTDAWCAATMTYIGIVAGITDIILPECSCSAMIALYKSKGRWMENDAYVPKPGDLVMYAWKGQKGENTLAPDHVGMVISVDGKNIKVVEGNYDNQVKIRDICVEYVKTRGYCLPDYGSLVCGFSDVPPDSWCADEINHAAELGLMVGVGGGLFEPDRPVTRGELAAVAVRLAEMMGK